MALKDVLIDELRDMYSAENQLVKALPKLAKGANDSQLGQLFQDHLEETKGQVLRLKRCSTAWAKSLLASTATVWKGLLRKAQTHWRRMKKVPRLIRGSLGRLCGRNIMRLLVTKHVSPWPRPSKSAKSQPSSGKTLKRRLQPQRRFQPQASRF